MIAFAAFWLVVFAIARAESDLWDDAELAMVLPQAIGVLLAFVLGAAVVASPMAAIWWVTR